MDRDEDRLRINLPGTTPPSRRPTGLSDLQRQDNRVQASAVPAPVPQAPPTPSRLPPPQAAALARRGQNASSRFASNPASQAAQVVQPTPVPTQQPVLQQPAPVQTLPTVQQGAREAQAAPQQPVAPPAPVQQPESVIQQPATTAPQPQTQTAPQAQVQQAQQQTSPLALPDGAIEVIRGGPRGTRVSLARPDAQGRFTEGRPNLSRQATQLVDSAAQNVGTPQGAVDTARLAQINPEIGQFVVDQNQLTQGINAQQQLQNEDNAARSREVERNIEAQRRAAAREANQPRIESVTDEFGAESLVSVNPATGTSRAIQQEGSGADNRAEAQRQIRRDFPDATDEEIESFLQQRFGS